MGKTKAQKDTIQHTTPAVASKAMLQRTPLLRQPVTPRMGYAPAPEIQRKTCACGGEIGADGECSACRARRETIQRKMTVNQPGDAYEQEADQVARQVMRQADEPEPVRPSIMRRLTIQRQAQQPSAVPEVTPDIETSIQSARGGGQSMPPDVQRKMEDSLGADLGGVRIHQDSRADHLNRQLNARAFTTGNDVFFKQGEYNPTSSGGQELLAHELTHTVQQGATQQLVHRAPEDPAQGIGNDPAVNDVLQTEINAAAAGANQNDNLMLRASANRMVLLLTWRTRPPLKKQEDLDIFVKECKKFAPNEIDTLTAFSPAGAELALVGYPKGFPLTWSGRVHAALTFGADPATIFAEVIKLDTTLTAQALTLGKDIYEHGLPVPFDDFSRLDKGFRLRLSDAHSEKPSAVRGYAREAIRHMQLKWVASFLLSWELIVNEVASAVAAGKIVPSYADWKDFVDNKQAILRDLPARARDQLAKTEEEAQQLQTDALNLSNTMLMVGMTSALISLFGLLSGWTYASDRFDAALLMADGMVAGSGMGDRIITALKWAWANSYFSGAAAAAAQNMIDHGPETLREVVLLLIVGRIPILNIPVAMYLIFTAARDVVELTTELVASFDAVMQAKNVTEMQRASARLAQIFINGAFAIVIVLITAGIAKVAGKISKRAAELRAADKTLTEEAAQKRAMQELSAEERKALEQGPAKTVSKFKEFEGFCSLGSINCSKLPDHVAAEAGAYPKAYNVPMPGGKFMVQKSILSGVLRGTEHLRDIARANSKDWPHFEQALAKAKKQGKDWPYDANGKPWEVHHIKPVFMGGDNSPGNLIPLPKAIHQEYTNWWNKLHGAFKKRFTETEWDQIYGGQKDVPGSRVPINPK